MGWLIALAVLLALAWFPLGIRLCYDESGPLVTARIGGVPVRIYPRPPKKEKKSRVQPKVDRKKSTKEEKTAAPAEQPQRAPTGETPKLQNPGEQPKVAGKPMASAAEKTEKPTPVPQPAPQSAPKKKGGSLTDFLPLVKLGLELLGDFRRKLRITRLDFKVILAGNDPCDLAVNYGRAWAAIGNLLPRLEQYFVIRKRNIEVECDFVGSETLIEARVDLSITLGRTLLLAAVYGVRGLKEFLNLKNRKGGALV